MDRFKKEDRAIPSLVVAESSEAEFYAPSALEIDNYNCFGITGKDSRTLSLKVFQSDGSIILIHYGRLSASIIKYHKKMIEVRGASLRLELWGTNLVPLLDYLGEQRLAWVKSAGIGSETDAFMSRKGEPEITLIKLDMNSGNPLEGTPKSS